MKAIDPKHIPDIPKEHIVKGSLKCQTEWKVKTLIKPVVDLSI